MSPPGIRVSPPPFELNSETPLAEQIAHLLTDGRYTEDACLRILTTQIGFSRENASLLIDTIRDRFVSANERLDLLTNLDLSRLRIPGALRPNIHNFIYSLAGEDGYNPLRTALRRELADGSAMGDLSLVEEALQNLRGLRAYFGLINPYPLNLEAPWMGSPELAADRRLGDALREILHAPFEEETGRNLGFAHLLSREGVRDGDAYLARIFTIPEPGSQFEEILRSRIFFALNDGSDTRALNFLQEVWENSAIDFGLRLEALSAYARVAPSSGVAETLSGIWNNRRIDLEYRRRALSSYSNLPAEIRTASPFHSLRSEVENPLLPWEHRDYILRMIVEERHAEMEPTEVLEWLEHLAGDNSLSSLQEVISRPLSSERYILLHSAVEVLGEVNRREASPILLRIAAQNSLPRAVRLQALSVLLTPGTEFPTDSLVAVLDSLFGTEAPQHPGRILLAELRNGRLPQPVWNPQSAETLQSPIEGVRRRNVPPVHVPEALPISINENDAMLYVRGRLEFQYQAL